MVWIGPGSGCDCLFGLGRMTGGARYLAGYSNFAVWRGGEWKYFGSSLISTKEDSKEGQTTIECKENVWEGWIYK